MKRLLTASLAAAFAFTCWVSEAQAQYVFLGPSVTIPMSDYGDYANTGWMFSGGAVFPVGEGPVSVGASGYFGSNNHDTDGDKTNLYGAMGLVGVSLVSDPDASARPFVYGGLGFMTHSYKSEEFSAFEDSSSGLAAQGGAGLAFAVSDAFGLMLAGSYNIGFLKDDETGETNTTYLGVTAAAQIPLGN